MTSHPPAPQQGIRQRIRNVVLTTILFEVGFAYCLGVALHEVYTAPPEVVPSLGYLIVVVALFGGVMTIVDAKHRIRA